MSANLGCVYLALTTLGCFAGGSLYGWSGYLPAVRAQFSIDNAAGAMVLAWVAALSLVLVLRFTNQDTEQESC